MYQYQNKMQQTEIQPYTIFLKVHEANTSMVKYKCFLFYHLDHIHTGTATSSVSVNFIQIDGGCCS